MTTKKKIAFIVNPISGTQNKNGVLELVEQKLDRSRFDYSIVRTEYAGHATSLAREFSEKGMYDAVIAIGGDGTVNEIARSLVNTSTIFGVIPCGSGNGLARHLHIPMDATGAIDLINRFDVERLDYGTINGIPFFCTCGVGFDAFVSSKFAASEKRGLLTYLENTLREGVKYKPDTYEIEIEGKTSRYKAFLIACANASQYGNNAYIAPHASMSDGLMDVTIMEPFTVLEAPQIAIQLFNKTLSSNSRIKSFRCKNIRIHRDNPGVIHFDGDPVMVGTDIDVHLVEKGLNVIVNSKQEDGNVAFTRRVSLLWEEFTTLSMNVGNKNLRWIQNFNKEVVKRLKG